MKSFFSGAFGTSTDKDEPKVKSVDEKYKESLKKENEVLDEKAFDQTKKSILDLIEKGINKKYFREDRLDTFFQKCFDLTHEQADDFAQNERFKRFMYTDLKTILQVTNKPENLT